MFFTGSLNRPFPSIRLTRYKAFQPPFCCLPVSPTAPNHSPTPCAHPPRQARNLPIHVRRPNTSSESRFTFANSVVDFVSYLSVCVCVCDSVCFCVFVCVCVCSCACIRCFARLTVCHFVSTHSMCSHLCVCIGVSVCLCVCVSVCLYLLFVFVCVYRMLLVLYSLHSPVSLLSTPYSTFPHLASFIFHVSRYTHSHSHNGTLTLTYTCICPFCSCICSTYTYVYVCLYGNEAVRLQLLHLLGKIN